MNQREIESVVAGAQILAVGKDQPDAEDAELGLRAGVEEPLVRAELRAGVGNFADVEKGAELELHDSVAVDVLVDLPVFEKVVAAQRGAALADRRACRCGREAADRCRARGRG